MSSSIVAPESMSKMLDSKYETWSFTRSDNSNPAHLVYIRDFSADKTKVFIRTFDWDNLECLVKAKEIIRMGAIATLQKKNSDGVHLVTSNKLKEQFGDTISIIYQGKDSEEQVCAPSQAVFLDKDSYDGLSGIFIKFCVESISRKKAK